MSTEERAGDMGIKCLYSDPESPKPEQVYYNLNTNEHRQYHNGEWWEVNELARARRLARLLAKQQPSVPAFSVHVGKLTASNGVSYLVTLVSKDRPKDATVFDDTGMMVPYETDNYENALEEARDWAKFLGTTLAEIAEK